MLETIKSSLAEKVNNSVKYVKKNKSAYILVTMLAITSIGVSSCATLSSGGRYGRYGHHGTYHYPHSSGSGISTEGAGIGLGIGILAEMINSYQEKKFQEQLSDSFLGWWEQENQRWKQQDQIDEDNK